MQKPSCSRGDLTFSEDPQTYREDTQDRKKSNTNYAYDNFDENIENQQNRENIQELHDPRNLPELQINETPLHELHTFWKIWRVMWSLIRLVLVLAFLYLFICSLDILSSACQLLGGRVAGELFKRLLSSDKFLSNPVCGVMIGVLTTVILQSSAFSRSIVISMVGAYLLRVEDAIPILMGVNIGTSVTNTIVSLFLITNKDEFRRAFAGATVHDMFNWLTVIVLLPLEVASGYLLRLSEAIVSPIITDGNDYTGVEFLTVITRPFTKMIIQVDKRAIMQIALGRANKVTTFQKFCCGNIVLAPCNSSTLIDVNSTYSMLNPNTRICKSCEEECNYIFFGRGLTDFELGLIIFVLSLIILCVCVVCIVKLLNSLLQGNIREVIRCFINAEFPGKAKYFTGYIAIVIGSGFTILFQSSSIFTSTLTPLVGVGVITIERMYPFTLGANIGTTITGILTTLTYYHLNYPLSLQVTLCLFFFNISGIILFYPIPFMRWPLLLAKFLGNKSAKYRWYAIAYLIVMFILFPLSVFGLSVAGWYVLLAVYGPIALLAITIAIIKTIQRKKPGILPEKLRNWKFLPEPLRSLDPYDRVLCCLCRRSSSCRYCQVEEDTNYSVGIGVAETMI